MSRTPDRAEPDAGAARPDGRQQPLLVVGAQDQRGPGGRLLERLEQRRLGVVVHPVRVAEDRDPRAALDGQQRELDGQAADGAGLGVLAIADPDLAAGALGLQAVQVRMVAVLHHPAAATRPARPVGPLGARAQERGREVHRERELADGRAVPPAGCACGTRVASIARTAATAAGCPTVGKPSMAIAGTAWGVSPRRPRRAFGLRGARFFGARRLGGVRRDGVGGGSRVGRLATGRALLRRGCLGRRGGDRGVGRRVRRGRRGGRPATRRARLGGRRLLGDGLRRRRPRLPPWSCGLRVARAFGAGASSTAASTGASARLAWRAGADDPAAGRPWPIWARSSSSSSGGHLAPRLAAARAARGARSNRSGRSWRGPRDGWPPRLPGCRRLRLPAAAADRADGSAYRLGAGAAASAAAAVSLALDGGRVGAASTAAATAASAAATATAVAAALGSPALGDQVLGDLGLLEVLLVVGERREAARRRPGRPGAELRVPHGPERRRARRARRGVERVEVVERRRQLAGARARGARGASAAATGSAATASPSSSRRSGALDAGLLVAPAAATAATAAAPATPAAVRVRPQRSPSAPSTPSAPSAPSGASSSSSSSSPSSGSSKSSATPDAGLEAARDSFSPGRATSPDGAPLPPPMRTPRRRPRAPSGSRTTGRHEPPRPAPPRGPTATAATTATTAATGALGLLLGDLGHRQVLLVVRRRGGPNAWSSCRRVAIWVMSVNRSATSIRSDDVLPRKLMTSHRTPISWTARMARGEVAVARHDDGDVEVARGLHQVDDELDVEVRLDLAVAVLADVLADDLVLVAREELVEVALVLVVRVEPGIGIRADEIASGGGRLQQRDVVDVHAGRLGRVEDVRHVHEDGDVLAHSDSYGGGAVRPSRPPGALGSAGGRTGRRDGAPERWPGGGEPGPLEAGEVRGIGGLVSPRPTSNPCCSRSGGAPPGAHRSRGPRRGRARRPGGRPCPRSRRRRPTDGGRGARRRRARVALRRRACSRSAGRRAGASGPRHRGIRGRIAAIDARPMRGQAVDVRDAGLSNQVLHAEGRTSCSKGGRCACAPVQTWIGGGGHACRRIRGPGGERLEARQPIPGAMATPCIRVADVYHTASLDRPCGERWLVPRSRSRHRRIRATTGSTRDGPRFPRRTALGSEGVGGGVHEVRTSWRGRWGRRHHRDRVQRARPAAAAPRQAEPRSRSGSSCR